MMDFVTVVCAPLSRMPLTQVPGATVRKCDLCGDRVWLSPTSLDLARTIRTVCPPCSRKLTNVEIKAPTRAQIQEVLRALKHERQ